MRRALTTSLNASRFAAAVALLFLGVSCVHPSAPKDGATPAPRSRPPSEQLDHLLPRRDSVGSAPKAFTWTAFTGADSYAIGVWNDVDVLVWVQRNIPTNSVNVPADVELPAGTYMWSVSAVRDGEEIADSGLSAFVVRSPGP